MSEIRHDPLTSHWVIMAPERLSRPGAEPVREPTADGDPESLCPFCPGNESLTPPEIAAVRSQGRSNDAGWTSRVIPNRYPALQVEPQMKKMGAGLYDWIVGVGAHEVMIESRRHLLHAADLGEAEWLSSFLMLQQRINDLRNDFRLLSLIYIKNQGTSAGATIPHTHAQILALPIMAPALDVRLQNGMKYERFHGRCGYCDRLAQEIREEKRIVWTGERMVVYEPYAALFPFGTLFQPRDHEACFERASLESLTELAAAMKSVLDKMRRTLGVCALQWVLYTAPLQGRNWDPFFDWHLELRPVLFPIGGVEWGSGITINPVLPELAAEQLRSG